MSIRRTSAFAPQAVSVASNLSPEQRDLALKQAFADATSVNRGNPAVSAMNSGEVVSFFPVPKKITINITNTDVDTDLEAKVLNASTFGNPADGLTVTYSDGFAGKLLERLMATATEGKGIMVYGFNISGFDADGAKSDAVINNSGLEARYYNGKGNSYVPVDLDPAGSERNTQTKDGLLTIKAMFMLNAVMQLRANIDMGCRLQLVLFTKPLQD